MVFFAIIFRYKILRSSLQKYAIFQLLNSTKIKARKHSESDHQLQQLVVFLFRNTTEYKYISTQLVIQKEKSSNKGSILLRVPKHIILSTCGAKHIHI